jgi:uncharacterized membrane protein
MADLIVLAFDTESQAEGAYNKIQELQHDLIVELVGLALVKVDREGKTHVETPGATGKVGIGAASGALFGTLIGLLFFIPVVGLVAGGMLGALFAGLDKTGLNAAFRNRVQETVGAGKSAVVLYALKITEDKFTATLAPYGGQLIQTSLSAEDEKELADGLNAR